MIESKTMNKKPKLIFIDWNKTLSYSKFWGHLETDNKVLFDQIQICLFDKNKHLIDPWMTGKSNSEQICEQVAKELSLSFNKIYKEFIKSCKTMKFSSNNIPKIIKKTRDMGTKVYIATDNMDSFDRWTVPSMKLDKMFDGIINSNKIGILKNEFSDDGKSLFLKDVLEKEFVEPYETILIDDSVDTIYKFSKFGVGCIKVDEGNSLDKIMSHL